ncbi:uncharacterized protein LOC126252837 isoform X1 [Schistocerca nitens]|uniref:uncharacterized protein LOC126252837 isoform X1 n=1 Tax=Schistocerca nitens TaxID=7011 RepID=UPI002118EE41|nr:uncharacterized protein LOC126252837 isoform X1 [Schistocerca nitens]
MHSPGDRTGLERRKESSAAPLAGSGCTTPDEPPLLDDPYPFALVLRLRVLQIVCGISAMVMGTVTFIEEQGALNLGLGIPAGAATVAAAGAAVPGRRHAVRRVRAAARRLALRPRLTPGGAGAAPASVCERRGAGGPRRGRAWIRGASRHLQGGVGRLTPGRGTAPPARAVRALRLRTSTTSGATVHSTTAPHFPSYLLCL